MSLFSSQSDATPKESVSKTRPTPSAPFWRRPTVIVATLLIAGATWWGISWFANSSHEDRIVSHVKESEELILTLTPELKKLNESVLNLVLPDHHSTNLFAENVTVVPFPADGDSPAAQASTSRSQLSLCRELIGSVDHFVNAKFYFVRGEVAADGVFESEMGFDALARTANGAWRSIHGSLDVTWNKADRSENGEPQWKITAWRGTKLEAEDRDALMFEDVLALAIPDAEVRADAQSAVHEQHVIDQYKTGKPVRLSPQYAKYFRAWADNMHPGLSVVDFDDDGWDDLYVMRRWEKNLLFHNQQDGTFVEMAAEVGLDLPGVTTSAIFADFDNDGDQDAFLGRTLQRSTYLTNEDGKFVNKSDMEFPYFVTSLSAADYNGDGLLDVYLCTYAIPDVDLRTKEDAMEFFPRDVVDRLWDKVGTADLSARYLDLSGPPNLLLRNVGNGKFAKAPESEQVELWRTSLQATWADYDHDDDPDLYVANDYAPDCLFRNDGEQGFVEITREAGGEAMMGLGMGASFGDFDLDGKQDLYVSNMYSKAGRRITAQVDGIDPRFVRSAEGNLLFHKGEADKFELVSSVEPPGMQVAKAGWSWGGQFADLNNDGWLDIYVGSGFYTAPKAIASDVDL